MRSVAELQRLIGSAGVCRGQRGLVVEAGRCWWGSG